ncbi:MAG: c-type cytochrome [Halieaceae bacterium]|jgi:cytochrome c553|uniref:c-type cytochrome n=1 Tax=Haliea alexandrii TaxID=2448162 RepID=UPI000F0AF7AB|nr:c-type cytochrome [Haliea alexandrii]MCR9185589.1 c-type cytochrome [Halieaceae bacterium]
MHSLFPPLLGLFLAIMAFVARADESDGAALYAPCAACHGAAAEGNVDLRAPRLNHLRPVYILAQLDKFQRGLRGGNEASVAAQQMAESSDLLPTVARLPELAFHISELTSPASSSTLQGGDPIAGGKSFMRLCGACHGANAMGNVALNAPRLAGADDWYLLAQLQAFREGQRGRHREDRTGRQMRNMAAMLSDEQALQDVIAYIRSQQE